jgi:hypothetical protein
MRVLECVYCITHYIIRKGFVFGSGGVEKAATWRGSRWRESSLEARGGKREREIFVFFILFN